VKHFPRIILLFAAVDWPIFMRKKMVYALARAAAKRGSTVVAVNRPLCPFTTFIKKPQRTSEFFDDAPLEKLEENLYLYSPRYFINDNISRKNKNLEKLNLIMLRKAYDNLQTELKIEEPAPIVWFYHPVQNYVTDLFPASFNIFEIKDNLTDFDGNEIEYVNSLEERKRGQIDLMLAVSPNSMKKYGGYYNEAWMSGNGLDRDTYETLSRDDIKVMPEMMDFDSPRIGFTGILSDRQNWDLILKIAERKPEWNFIFVGKISTGVPMAQIEQAANVILTGSFDHSRMPRVLKSFDLGIMPYRDNKFFRFSNPLKFYEFAAAGLRSVSSTMELLYEFDQDFVRVVENDPDLWIESIADLLKRDKEEAARIGREIAGRFIWENMAEELLAKLEHEYFRG